VQHFFNALAINPNADEANLQVALYEHQNGKLRESIGYYEKFLATADDITTHDKNLLYQVLINLGHVYRRLGDAERARRYFEPAAKYGPK
jgi:tetratricopeptide (TPR) repeat protein